MPNIDITDDVADVYPDGGDVDVEDDSTPDPPIDSDVDDDADREPDGYDETNAEDIGDGGDPIPPDSTPDVDVLPDPVQVYREVRQEQYITDYSAASLAEYEESGATAWAVYDDGTEAQMPWSAVTDPSPADVVATNEAAAVAAATNQRFWQRSTDPSGDGAGTGAFVTDEEQDAFLAAAAAGFPDASKPYHNLLMNSFGILLRTAIKNLVSITRSAIAFFDGEGNEAENVVASFGRDGAQIGKGGGYHASIGANRFGLLYDIDRLFEVSADGREVSIYAGGSTKAGDAKYSNAEVAAIFDMLYTCHGEAGSDIVYITATNQPSGYRFHKPLPLSGSFMIDVIDQDGDFITCGDMDGIFYDGDVTTQWNSRTGMWDLVVDARFIPNIMFDPQAETAGVARFHAGDAELVFTGGYVGGPTPPESDDSTKLATTEWVNNLLGAFPFVQRGTIAPSSHAASSSGSSAVAFADEFSAAPTVVVGIRGQTQTEGLGCCSAWASNVTASGFTLNFRNDFTSARTYGVYWVAVGGGSAGGSGGGGGDTSALERRIAELEADVQALAEVTAYVGSNHISIDGTTVADELNPITSGSIDGMEV